jgi:hypothetical protein
MMRHPSLPAACLQILLQVQHMAGAPQHQQYKGLIDILQRVPKEQGGYRALFRGGQRAGARGQGPATGARHTAAGWQQLRSQRLATAAGALQLRGPDPMHYSCVAQTQCTTAVWPRPNALQLRGPDPMHALLGLWIALSLVHRGSAALQDSTGCRHTCALGLLTGWSLACTAHTSRCCAAVSHATWLLPALTAKPVYLVSQAMVPTWLASCLRSPSSL